MNIDPSMVAQYGMTGIVLLWFMFRLEKKLDNLGREVSDLSSAMILDLLSRENLSSLSRVQAEQLLKSIQDRRNAK